MDSYYSELKRDVGVEHDGQHSDEDNDQLGSILNTLKPIFSGWGAIWHVSQISFTHSTALPDKFEPGTPNLNWAVSLLKAFEYIDSIWGYETIENIEHDLVEYFLDKAKNYPYFHIIWSKEVKNRVSVFWFVIDWMHSHDVAEILAEANIAVRSWKHCAQPLFKSYWHAHSVRASLYIYNSTVEIDKFFDIIWKIKKN